MERYENGKIYRLVGSDGYFYIGSTCVPLCKRFYWHKQDNNKTCRKAVHYNNLGWNNVRIILIEPFPCKNKQELLKREQEEIDKYKNDEKCLNSCNAVALPRKEYDKINKPVYYQNNQEQILENKKKFYQENKERLRVSKSTKITCEICQQEIVKNHKARHQKSLRCQSVKKISPTGIENVNQRPQTRTEGTT